MDACHEQTILAYMLNDQVLRSPTALLFGCARQLGYKMAKYIMRIELVDDFAHIASGRGGYWEGHGHEWYAGI